MLLARGGGIRPAFSQGAHQTSHLRRTDRKPQTELRSHLEIAFVQLESFVSAEEYEILFHFKVAATLARELAKSGTPKDIICSARILKEVKGDRAVSIQERISE